MFHRQLGEDRSDRRAAVKGRELGGPINTRTQYARGDINRAMMMVMTTGNSTSVKALASDGQGLFSFVCSIQIADDLLSEIVSRIGVDDGAIRAVGADGL